MKYLFSIISILLISFFSLQLCAQNTTDFEHKTDQTFAPWNKPDVPGLAAGIIKDGKVIYLKGFGSANLATGAQVTPQTKFQIGELSKQFTSLAILLLMDQGKIDRQDDIRKYLTGLPEFKYKVTIAHLLNHSSGLDDVSRLNTIINGSSPIATQAEALKLIASQKALSFKPGTDFSFHESVTESILMAEIVSKSSGQSFAAFVTQNIFEPLGMLNSIIREDSNLLLADAAEPYQQEDGGEYKKHPVKSSVVGAINAYSTAEDLTKWYLHFTHPKGALGRLVQTLDTPVRLDNGEKFSYYWGEMAIGREFTHPERGVPIFWSYGLQGGYGANIFRYVDQNITSFVLGNGSQYNGSVAMDAIMPSVEGFYTEPPMIDYTKLKTKNLSASELNSFAGNYWYNKAGYASKLFVKNDTLRSQWLFTERYLTLLPVGENTFQQMASNEDVRLFKFKEEGDDMKLYFTYNEAMPDIMTSYDPIQPSDQLLRSYEGVFFNADYGCLFNVTVEGDYLMLKNLDHENIEFRPVKKDVFTSATMFMPSLEFTRNASGGVVGFKLNADGVRDFTFEKK